MRHPTDALAAPALASAADPPRYRAYYDLFDRGPALIPGHDTSLVPQGLTYWAARDALVISYYDSAGGASRIPIVDRASGRSIKTLLLRTTGHVGGLAMTRSGHLWVANNGRLVRYSASTLARGSDGGTITADRTFDVPASSFAGVRGNDLWVGRFARPAPRGRTPTASPRTAGCAPRAGPSRCPGARRAWPSRTTTSSSAGRSDATTTVGSSRSHAGRRSPTAPR